MTEATLSEKWGPLATPIHTDVDPPVDEDGISWWDYALFCWWDPQAEVYVMTHHMSTPDPDKPGRTRVSATVGDRSVEVIEHTQPFSHSGDTITVDLAGHIQVDHPDLKLDVTFDKLYDHIDFHKAHGLPTMKEDEPLHHYEHPQRASGTITLKGDSREFSATGLRDRTWGYRNETSQWAEYQYIMAELDDSFITLMKIKGTVGPQRDIGIMVSDDGQTDVGYKWGFNGSGLINDFTVDLPSGARTFEIVERPSGFWVPMGWRQEGTVFSAYDEFILFKDEDGQDYAGLATYGIQRKLD